jgi:hypothetical protein
MKQRTMTGLDKIKDKIKKLFALSKSPNANEAAAALEMAQKLMAEYGVKYAGSGEFEITEIEVKANGGEKPPRYEVYLMGVIAEAFGCQCAYGRCFLPDHLPDIKYSYHHTFIGLEHRVKIATFIADVLLRKLKNARSAYIKTLGKVRIRKNKISRADDFCLGWAVTVASKLHEFANTPDEQAAIDMYVANLGWGDELKTIKRKSVRRDLNDFVKGRKAAADVQIQHGVEGKGAGALLLED